jgi:2-C-methyl-D-erythritol 4-phosphate cytidylyltransferase
MDETVKFIAIVPAAGVGKRMGTHLPKQYLSIHDKTILEHTTAKLLSHPKIDKVILSLDEHDQYFCESPLASNSCVIRVSGGKERVDSVLNGLLAVNEQKYPWVLVHDAARPCVSHHDINQLITQCLTHNSGGVLAVPVRDTMKRGYITPVEHKLTEQSVTSLPEPIQIKVTVDREQLWHALTPQMYKTTELTLAIERGLTKNLIITDESSAIEQANLPSLLVAGSSENIKITHPDDLLLAEFYLGKQACTLVNKEL